MALRYHLSAAMGEWMECRAKEGNCPYGGHADLGGIVNFARRQAAAGREVPTVRNNAGTRRGFVFEEDGSYRLGSRRFTKDGEPVLSDSSLRSRRSRGKRRTNPPPAKTPAETAAPVIKPVPTEPVFANKKDKLAYVAAMARKKMDEVGLGHIPFEFDRSMRALGRTHYRKRDGQWTAGRITLSRYWSERLPVATIADTIAHECAHALVPYEHDHDEVWRAKCLELGGSGEATHDSSDLPPEMVNAWKGTCPAGHVTWRQAMPDAAYCCHKCVPGPYDPAHRFAWERDGVPVPDHKMGKRYRDNLAYVLRRFAA